MLARRCDEHEVLAVAEVLHVGKPLCLSPCAFEFRDRKSVALDELGIHSARIFAVGDPSLEEEAVTLCEITHRKLLDESFKRSGLRPIFHVGPHAKEKSGEFFRRALPKARVDGVKTVAP